MTAGDVAARLLAVLPDNQVIDEAALGLAGDPRYLIGRLAQALADLLAAHQGLPLDDRSALLADAIRDAIEARDHRDDFARAQRYHLLALELGVFGR